MTFYDLSKDERNQLVSKLEMAITADVANNSHVQILKIFSDSDTYIRKTGYIYIGRLYKKNIPFRSKIIEILETLYDNKDEKIRQTVVYSLGEIGKTDIDQILAILEKALFDKDHSVRNAAIGSLKQMGAKNPKPTFKFIGKFITHNDPKVRKEVIHGMELRGRTHPQEILPLLKKLENDQSKLVKDTIIHVIGQISYKKGCLEKVVNELSQWKNKELIDKAVLEIIDVHKRYEKFSAKSFKEAQIYIKENLKNDSR